MKKSDVNEMTISALSIAFCNQLKEDLGEEVFSEMVSKHISDDAVNEGHCVSHEFCDANESMLSAFKSIYTIDLNFQDSNNIDLINKAWSLAKEKNFYKN